MSQQLGRQVAAGACPDQNLEQICSCGRKSSHEINGLQNGRLRNWKVKKGWFSNVCYFFLKENVFYFLLRKLRIN